MSDQPRIPLQIAGPIALALLILLGLLAIHIIEPPPAADANAPLAEFSAARAMRDVREIAKAPRMLGSAENDRVRDYLVGRLRELGASPAVQTCNRRAAHSVGPGHLGDRAQRRSNDPRHEPDRLGADGCALRLGAERTRRRRQRRIRRRNPRGDARAQNRARGAQRSDRSIHRRRRAWPAWREGFRRNAAGAQQHQGRAELRHARRPWPVDDVPDQVATFVARGEGADSRRRVPLPSRWLGARPTSMFFSPPEWMG